MDPTNRKKYEQYQSAVLQAAGFASFPSTNHSETYDLIIQPAFSRTCGIRISFLEDIGEISIVLFADRCKLFEAVWKEDDDETEFEILRSSESCRRSNSLLDPIDVVEIRRRIREADPWTFGDPPDDGLGGRDGIGGLSVCRRGTQLHRFRFATCEAEITPRQHGYFSIFCEQAVVAFANQNVELRYLTDLSHYGW